MGGVNNRRIAGGVKDSGRMRGPGRRRQEDKDEEDERTRMWRTRMISTFYTSALTLIQ